MEYLEKKNKNLSILKNTSQKYYFLWKTYIYIIYFLKILKGWPPKCFKIPFNLTRSLEFSSFFYLDHFPNNLWAKRISAKKYATLKYSIKSAGLAKYFSTTYAHGTYYLYKWHWGKIMLVNVCCKKDTDYWWMLARGKHSTRLINYWFIPQTSI